VRTHADRLIAAQRLLAGEGAIDAFWFQDPSDIRWLSGFSGSVAQIVLRSSGATLIVDSRYAEQALAQVPDCHVVTGATAAVRETLLGSAVRGCRRVGFDDRRTSVADWQRLKQSIEGQLVGQSSPLSALRSTKDSEEIARIERAARAADLAYSEVRPMLGTLAMTERDVRDELELRMRRYGADAAAYPTIVAAGPNSAFPHHRPTERLIREGDSVVIDVGAEVDGYRSDMTRTVLVGEVESLLSRLYAAVHATQQAIVATVAPGVVAGDLDEMSRELLAEFEDLVAHATGHGVGLDIHESPWLRRDSTEVLQVNHVVTVEPGLYRVGVGGVRIEDLLLVETTGSRALTTSPKDPSCRQSAPMT